MDPFADPPNHPPLGHLLVERRAQWRDPGASSKDPFSRLCYYRPLSELTHRLSPFMIVALRCDMSLLHTRSDLWRNVDYYSGGCVPLNGRNANDNTTGQWQILIDVAALVAKAKRPYHQLKSRVLHSTCRL